MTVQRVDDADNKNMKNNLNNQVPVKFGIVSSKLSKNGRLTMNSKKWREVPITRETILDLIASHLYAMRGMDRREITEIDVPALLKDEMIMVQIKMKEVNKGGKEAGRPDR